MTLTVNIIVAVVVAGLILFWETQTMSKLKDAADRVDASADKLLNAAQQLIAKFTETTAAMREIAANAVATTGDDAAIQLNATADKLDGEVAAIAAELGAPPASDAEPAADPEPDPAT